MHWYYRFNLWLRARRIFRHGERELRILHLLVDSNKESIDVGANKGVYTYFLLKFSRRVHAFEPNPFVYKDLSRCRLDNLSLYQCALSDRSGSETLWIPPHPRLKYNHPSSHLRSDHKSGGISIGVQLEKLDNFGLDNIGFMKIDVEGHESHVMRGAIETIKINKPIMLIEIESRFIGESYKNTIRAIKDMGYHALCLDGETVLDPLSLGEDQRSIRGKRINNFLFIPRYED